MKLKLLMVFIGIVVILLMAGLEIVQGEDVGYPAPVEIGYPDPYWGYPIEDEILGYPVVEGVPDGFYITNNPVIPDSSIEPQYVNGRNLWQEIVFRFDKLLALIK